MKKKFISPKILLNRIFPAKKDRKMIDEKIENLDYRIRKTQQECDRMHHSVVVEQNASPAMESFYKMNVSILEYLKKEKQTILDQNGKQ